MIRTRREFLQMLALAAVPAAASGAACSDGDGSSGLGGGSGGGAGGGSTSGTGGGGPLGDGGSTCSAIAAEIATNHPHAVDVTLDDVLAGAEKTYVITGGHTHSITVTAAQFAAIAAGGSVMVTSTEDGAGPHSHLVTITCTALG